MLSILQKEINGFLSSLIAYIVMAVFLIATGMFMWIVPGMNIFDNAYASLDTLFSMGPWLFMFLVSAITMRSFSEEKRTGTIELLSTKPLTDWDIILGKYLAGVFLVLFSIIPTLIYFYSVYQLGSPKGNIDIGATWGSYLGLFLLASCFVSIGIFASAASNNQIVAFILSMFLCFFFFIVFDLFSDFRLLGSWDNLIEYLSINTHYDSISRGVLDSRDLIYFLSFNLLFLHLTHLSFSKRKW
jgi:ABC-2 type transport system permease protein